MKERQNGFTVLPRFDIRFMREGKALFASSYGHSTHNQVKPSLNLFSDMILLYLGPGCS